MQPATIEDVIKLAISDGEYIAQMAANYAKFTIAIPEFDINKVREQCLATRIRQAYEAVFAAEATL